MIKNCTPHKLHVHTPNGIVVLNPCGTVPRVVVETSEVGSIDGIPITTSRLAEVEGLPPFEFGVHLVVSQIVANAATYRDDLLFPGQLIRDKDGQPCGCKGLFRARR